MFFLVLVLLGFFERVMDGLCGSRLAARPSQEENMQHSKKLVIEPLRQSIELLRQYLWPWMERSSFFGGVRAGGWSAEMSEAAAT
jgi:hypothetical protein